MNRFHFGFCGSFFALVCSVSLSAFIAGCSDDPTSAEEKDAHSNSTKNWLEEECTMEVPLSKDPFQCSDPRAKKIASKEQYDMLDLPTEAEVDDRFPGLLETCVVWGECYPQNIYRFREDGSWTLETNSEYLENKLGPCDSSTQGKIGHFKEERVNYLKDLYFKCSDGLWQETDEHCDEGSYGIVNEGNPKYPEKEYGRCENGDWVSVSEVEYYCHPENLQIGDICSYPSISGWGIGATEKTLTYIYTENGWELVQE